MTRYVIEPLFAEQTDILLRPRKFIGARVETGDTDKKSHTGTWILAQ